MDEHGRSIRKLVSYDIEERLWTKSVVLWTRTAALRFQGCKAKLQDVESVTV